MSSTREEILAALAVRPAGLTSKELAPMCPACECDELVVGRTIAALRADNLIHSGNEFRAGGGTVWITGPTPQERVEERVPLVEQPVRSHQSISAAAHAIAAMRPADSFARRTTTSSLAVQAPREGVIMRKKTVAQRCADALKQHGRLTLAQLVKHAQSTKGSISTMGAQLKALGVVRVAHGVYAMAGTEAAKAQPERETAKARQLRKPREQQPPAPRASGDDRHLNGEVRFAINEQGELDIQADGARLALGADAFTRLRDFIDRTKSIWEPA